MIIKFYPIEFTIILFQFFKNLLRFIESFEYEIFPFKV